MPDEGGNTACLLLHQTFLMVELAQKWLFLSEAFAGCLFTESSLPKVVPVLNTLTQERST